MIKSKSTSFKQIKSLLPLVLIILILGIYLKGGSDNKNNLENFKNKIIPAAVQKIINNPATKFSIGKVSESSGLYEFELVLGEGANSKKYTSYITKDGKILFTSGIKLADLEKPNPTQETKGAKKISCSDLDKNQTPKLTAFVVSNCPYGLQMQRLFNKTISELPQILPNLTVRYLGSIVDGKITSMHGEKEAQENLRQICIREEQNNKYWDYLSCYIQEGKSEECLANTGTDTSKLNSCMTDSNRGLKYAKVDFDLSGKLNIGSSPTLLLNDKQIVSEFDFGGRIPNAIREIVGCSYQTRPEAFKKDLSKENVASSFSKTDNSSNSNSTAANCGK